MKKQIWVVVEVQSGIAVNVRPYQTEAAAKRYVNYRSKRLNPDDDDIQMFEISR